jgi:hypothetical protein
MTNQDLFEMLAADDLFFDHEEVSDGFRQERGSHSAGRWEDDPEMTEYEDLMELGLSLR